MAAVIGSGCGGDSAESLGLGPQLNTNAPQVVTDNQFTTVLSGLKLYDFVVGTGETVNAGDIATVHYTGWLTNGTKFDSSVDRNEPFSFRLGVRNVILGWDEGVQGMRVGGKRQLVIPPALAYGNTGAGSIPPNSTLVFEIELLGVD
ncbi:MAG TPA: peptidylprolyl isomerase [Candidatus Latescibacteria bacterium]|nr:peptidylprolyl isomerase [Candidatus Latescibacterota bacterium]